MGKVLESLREAVSSFLAGSFFIVISLPFLSGGTDDKLAYYVSLVVGGLLIIVGLSEVVEVFLVGKSYGGKIEKWRKRVLADLYMVSWVQLGINVAVLYANGLVLLAVITGIFLLVVLAAMIYGMVRVIRQRNLLANIPFLLASALACNTLCIASVAFGLDRWVTISYGAVGIGLLLLTIRKYEKGHMAKGVQKE